jgi:O-antigen/teichoic acid export membrane protein
MVILSTFALLVSAYFIANGYYNKPIFYALLAGGIYIPISSIAGFFDGSFRAENKFKFSLIREIIYQFLRMSLVPLSIFLLMKRGLESQSLTAAIILILSLCFFLTFIFSYFIYKRKIIFSKEKKSKLLNEEKDSLKKFIWPITLTVLSGVFFGYIDTIMLGHFVTSEFIGYYSSAFSLIASAATIISFSSGAMFPILARLKGRQLERGFRKTRLITFGISFFSAIATFIFGKYLILIVYGQEYISAVPVLQLFALFVLIGPIISLYDTYFTSQERTKVIAVLLIISTFINIGLNLMFITYGLKFGMFEALLGAATATIISKLIYLFGLGLFKRLKKI